MPREGRCQNLDKKGRGKAFMLTLNNYTPEELQHMKDFADKFCTAATMGHEEGDLGTPHIQGWFKLKAPQTPKWMVAHLLDKDRGHWTATNRADPWYEGKDGVILYEKVVMKGESRMWDDIRTMIKAGADNETIFDKYSRAAKYVPALGALRAAYNKPKLTRYPTRWYKDFNPEPIKGRPQCIFLWGPPTTGKSGWAAAHFKDPIVCNGSCTEGLKQLNVKTDGIIWEEPNFSKWTVQDCIALCEIQDPRTINVKHGSVLVPAGVQKIFCSNVPFAAVFPEDTAGAIASRVTIVHLDDLVKVSE
ncbi:MAG: replication-associated protein [Cressdnaviricota sp.]|nr:MAG: replication-associated protein [Cressdnaviricota sp.]